MYPTNRSLGSYLLTSLHNIHFANPTAPIFMFNQHFRRQSSRHSRYDANDVDRNRVKPCIEDLYLAYNLNNLQRVRIDNEVYKSKPCLFVVCGYSRYDLSARVEPHLSTPRSY